MPKTEAAPKTTHIGFVIDESRSMLSNRAAVVAGYNEFITTMLKEGADGASTRCTVAFFDQYGDDERVRIKRDDVPLSELHELTIDDYSPRGNTPLNDAVSVMIGHLGKRMSEPDQAMLVILTDGQENRSEISTEDLRVLVRAKENAGWEFLYLGANVEAFAEVQNIGLSGKAGQYAGFTSSAQGTRNTMRRAAGQTASYATMDAAGYKAVASATPSQVAEDPAEFEEQERQLREAREKAKREASESLRSQASEAARKLQGSDD